MLNNDEYQIGTIVKLKKPHPSGTSDWTVVRVGADIKIKSNLKEGLYIMLSRKDFNKFVDKIIRF